MNLSIRFRKCLDVIVILWVFLCLFISVLVLLTPFVFIWKLGRTCQESAAPKVLDLWMIRLSVGILCNRLSNQTAIHLEKAGKGLCIMAITILSIGLMFIVHRVFGFTGSKKETEGKALLPNYEPSWFGET